LSAPSDASPPSPQSILPPLTSTSSPPSHMMSHQIPTRWDHHSDGSLSRLSSFPNFSTPLCQILHTLVAVSSCVTVHL
jgi:hypothetical protein